MLRRLVALLLFLRLSEAQTFPILLNSTSTLTLAVQPACGTLASENFTEVNAGINLSAIRYVVPCFDHLVWSSNKPQNAGDLRRLVDLDRLCVTRPDPYHYPERISFSKWNRPPAAHNAPAPPLCRCAQLRKPPGHERIHVERTARCGPQREAARCTSFALPPSLPPSLISFLFTLTD